MSDSDQQTDPQSAGLVGDLNAGIEGEESNGGEILSPERFGRPSDTAVASSGRGWPTSCSM